MSKDYQQRAAESNMLSHPPREARKKRKTPMVKSIIPEPKTHRGPSARQIFGTVRICITESMGFMVEPYVC